MSTGCAHVIPEGGYISHFLTNFDSIKYLGKGGFGVVREAKHKIDNRSYAIKRITLPNKPESRECVLREVRALAKLEHRNIVRYITAWIEILPPDFKFKDGMSLSDEVESSSETELNVLNNKRYEKKAKSESIVFEHSNLTNELTNEGNGTSSSCITEYLYMQMELCKEQSLKEWLLDNGIKDRSKKVKNIFNQILRGVEYVHKQKLIHRDLKPGNIFFSLKGKIKIGDFGLVTDKAGSNFKAHCEIMPQSDKHTPEVGTPLYMSPEQLQGRPYNYKVDIYSLGIILFELLVQFKTEMERNKTLESLKRNEFPSDFKQKFPNEFKLLRRMLSEDPNKRPKLNTVRKTSDSFEF